MAGPKIPKPPCTPRPPGPPPPVRPPDPGCGTGPDPRKVVEKLERKKKRR